MNFYPFILGVILSLHDFENERLREFALYTSYFQTSDWKSVVYTNDFFFGKLSMWRDYNRNEYFHCLRVLILTRIYSCEKSCEKLFFLPNSVPLQRCLVHLSMLFLPGCKIGKKFQNLRHYACLHSVGSRWLLWWKLHHDSQSMPGQNLCWLIHKLPILFNNRNKFQILKSNIHRP